MKKRTIFEGAATALITPFHEGRIDFEAFGRLIDDQIRCGIDGLVVAGTTGESPTLTDEEHRELIRYAVERVAGRVPVIAGTGSNDTDYAIGLTKFACEVGADAALVVTPYYNKTTQKGLIRMFTAIADASSIPLILYNVPSRTGVGIEPATYAELADHPMIGAIKEASGDLSKAAQTFALIGDKLDIYSGNDDQILPFLSLGGKGVISVLSNVLPAETVRMCALWREGRVREAASEQLRLLPLIGALFSEVNPIPVKAAMAALGYCENTLRLPLVEMEDAHRDSLLRAMKDAGIKL